MTEQDDVRRFMEANGQHAPETPTLANYPFELRAKLILEEAFEFVEASGYGYHERGVFKRPDQPADWAGMIDALCDLLYVTYGAAVAMGVDLAPFWAEVHKSNMSKLGPDGRPVYRTDGKVLKGPDYRPPDITGLLASLNASSPRDET